VKDNKRTNTRENRPKVALTRRRRPPIRKTLTTPNPPGGYPPLFQRVPPPTYAYGFGRTFSISGGPYEAEDLKALLWYWFRHCAT